jgi:SAM-dependent methyltransferase
MSRSNSAICLNVDPVVLPPVLDACCGGKAMWFDKADPRAVFVDRRKEEHMIYRGEKPPQHLIVAPDVVADFTALPFPDESFWHVVFDPPHCNRCSESGWLAKKYGKLVAGWEDMLRGGFEECFRVLRPHGTLIFKWSSVQIPLARVLALTPERPLYGHRSGANMKTHWLAFMKQNKEISGGTSAVSER